MVTSPMEQTLPTAGAARPRPSLLCIEPFHNPHIDSIYDALARLPGLRVIRACTGPLPEFRRALGWQEMPADADYLQPWRRPMDWLRLYAHLISVDFVLAPSPLTMPLPAFVRRLFGGRIAYWSEPFLKHPRKGRSAGWRNVAARSLLRFCDTSSVVLLENGMGAMADYRRLGVRRWAGLEFCYAIPPPARAGDSAPLGTVEIPKMIFVGSLASRKGFDLLAEAIADPRLAAKPWQLTIVGSGVLDDTAKALCIDERFRSRVNWLGTVPFEQVGAIMASADVLVLPSRFDGWGTVVNEALAHGLAVVCSDAVGASRQLVADGRCGLITKAGSRESLVASLVALLDRPRLLQRMRNRARRHFGHFAPDEVARRFQAVCSYSHASPLHGWRTPFCSGICAPIRYTGPVR